MTIRIAAGQSPVASQEYLTFAKQLGLTGVQLNTPDLPGEGWWHYEDLAALKKRIDSNGLTLEAIENLPNRFYDKAMYGLPGRDEQIENVRRTIANLGRAGVPVLGLHFMPQNVWRTSLAPLGRGEAVVSAYDHRIASDPAHQQEVWVARRDESVDDAKDGWRQGSHMPVPRTLTEQEMWDNYRYFVEAIIPIAESANVRIGFHPDDPPVSELYGVPHILRSVDALVTAANAVDSPFLGSELCLGTVSEMGGAEAVRDAIAELGVAGKIVYVHLRDVLGVVPRFTECFLGEGNLDIIDVLRQLHAVGFDGFILDDHTPALTGDSPYGYRGRAHAIGYLQAALEATAS